MSMGQTRRALIVGGTGPTGVPIVNGLLRLGYEVAVYHSGRHEATFDAAVEHLHGDPREPADIHDKLGGRTWDVAICTSGRLRALGDELAGKTGRLVGITGQPVYTGTLQPTPRGRMPLPVPEWAPRQRDAANYTSKVAEGEDQLFLQHGRGDFEAVVVRYPGVYGPRAPINHEWAVVKRALDRRPIMILPHDGLAYFQRGYAENVAQLVLLAATRPEAAGEAFNCGDERVLSARHVAEIIAGELGWQPEFVGVPAPLCRGVYPLAEKSNLILDLSKARDLLGYRDLVDPETATRSTARWLAANPPPETDLRSGPVGGSGAFDYAREDRIAAAWQRALGDLTAALADPTDPKEGTA